MCLVVCVCVRDGEGERQDECVSVERSFFGVCYYSLAI